MSEGNINPWQEFWGETYGPELKQHLLGPVFERLEAEDKIGDLIVDVGSGAVPVIQLLKPRANRKRICVDIAADGVRTNDSLRIRFDAEKVNQPELLSCRKALARISVFLGIDLRKESNIERADTILFSDILNYLDFKRVISGFSRFLKPGGRLMVFNLPYRGNRSLFSDQGLKDNRDLYRMLGGNRFEIESKEFPKRPRRETSEADELIVLIARKM
jgi:SAM-dependent methyltransferase